MEPVILTDYRQTARFQPDRFLPITLAETDRTKVVLTCFEPGQLIPVHCPGVDMALVVLTGEGAVVAGTAEAQIGPGAVVVVPAGTARGIRATTRLVAVHVVSPPPSEADHAAVQQGLSAAQR